MIITGTSGNDTLVGTSGNDSISGGDGNDLLSGLGGGDTLEGEGGNDSLLGGDASDVLIGGDGADTINGGNGSDILSYKGDTAGVSVNLLTNTASGGDATGDVISLLENITGGAGNDTLTGNSAANVIEGMGGADLLDGGAGIDTLNYASSSAAITINLATGLGNGGDAEGDTVSNFERVQGSGHNDTLIGGTANETLFGGLGSDDLQGGDGNDQLTGDVGDNLFDGGIGNDTVTSASASDIAHGGDGNDWFFMNAGGLAYGDADNDLMLSNGGNATLHGGDGIDTVAGSGGADVLVGGAGADTLYGANSAIDANVDRFVLTTVTDSGVGMGNRDVVVDFDAAYDQIDLTALGYGFVFQGAGALGVTSVAQVGYQYSALDGYTLVQGDIEGDGAVDFEMELTGEFTLTAANFLGVNAAPIAADDTVSVDEDASANLTSALLANDTDPGDAFQISAVDTTGTVGTVTFDSLTGSVSYAATGFDSLADGVTTTDTFTYTVTDSGGLTSTATATVTVTGVNDAPVAADDTVAGTEDTPITIAIADLLANDSDVDDAFSLDSFTSGAHGNVTLSGDGLSLIYTPAANYFGGDTFTYTIRDAAGATATASIGVTLASANDAPVATDDTVTAAEDAPAADVTATLLANDSDVDVGDTLTVAAVDTTGTVGTVTFDSLTGSVSYAATGFDSLAEGVTTTDTFTYTVKDNDGLTSTATATVTVTGVNDAPVAADDTVAGTEDTPITIAIADLLANDTDADTGDALTITGIDDSGTLGSVAFDTLTGSVTYSAATGFDALAEGATTTDAFLYTVTDSQGVSHQATATVVVTGVNDGPTAADDAAVTNEDTDIVIAIADLLANDGDIDGTISFDGIALQAEHGTVTVNPDGLTLTYSPSTNFNGADNFIYRIRDNTGATVTGSVALTVNSVNDLPNVGDDALTTAFDTPVTVLLTDLLANDSDAEGALTFSGITGSPDHGTVTVSGGMLTYTSTVGFSGDDTFVYQVTDSDGVTATATVTVTVESAAGQLIRGTQHNDTLNGTGGNDTIHGKGGDDLVNGNGGDDLIYGGAGSDHLYGNAGDDVIYGRGGNDTLDGGDGNDKLHASGGADMVIGGLGNDTLFGGGAANTPDTLDGGDGNDDIYAGNGNDIAIGGAGTDDIAGGNGNDNLSGGIDNDTLRGGCGNDTLDGGDGNDLLLAASGNDVVLGGAGNDTIRGGGDCDTVAGGAGADSFEGGNGNDRFVYTSLLDSTHAAKDTIDGWNRGDILDLSGLGFTGVHAGAASGSVLGYTYDKPSKTTTLTDGHDFVIAFEGKLAFVASDFDFV